MTVPDFTSHLKQTFLYANSTILTAASEWKQFCSIFGHISMKTRVVCWRWRTNGMIFACELKRKNSIFMINFPSALRLTMALSLEILFSDESTFTSQQSILKWYKMREKSRENPIRGHKSQFDSLSLKSGGRFV